MRPKPKEIWRHRKAKDESQIICIAQGTNHGMDEVVYWGQVRRGAPRQIFVLVLSAFIRAFEPTGKIGDEPTIDPR